jgi:hypothetical protein
MLIDILKDPKFDFAFSFLMGVFIMIVVRPVCKGDSCFNYKAPPMKDIREHAYKIGDTCYKFVPKDAKCPSVGVIEPFQWRVAASGR